MLTAGGPVSVRRLVAALTDELGPGIVDHKRVSDMLRYQAGLGRVRRVARGVYEVVPGAMSRSTAWRCMAWRRERDRRIARWTRDRAARPA